MRFADPKALGVLVFLGLGLTDLVRRSRLLVHAHRHHGLAGDLATWAFWGGAVLAAITVFFVARSVFPRLKQKADKNARSISVFYFGAIARHKSAAEYRAAVDRMSSSQLQDDIASQVWEIARIADVKHREARKAFYAVLFFLAAWATARVALSLAV